MKIEQIITTKLMENSSSTIYDYAIIGAGAAGLHLVHAMLAEEWFDNKRILIIEKESKEVDDRTWSFWEKGAGQWDSILTKSWGKGFFYSSTKEIPLELAPYQYKMMRSIDFYELGKKSIKEASSMYWQSDTVQSVQRDGVIINIKGVSNNYQAKQVFDSRITKEFIEEQQEYISLIQHFKGWVIETKQAVFDPNSFVMMDFRIKKGSATSFTYVLPISSTSAMVEFTLFDQELLASSDYDQYLKKYISEVLKIKDFKIIHEEIGTIPMTCFPFHQASEKRILKIGTAGSWVKPSSGYAFKNIERLAKQVVDNIKHNRPPDTNLLSKQFRFYDTLYLDVLATENELGESIFTDMYSNNPIQQIFKFLDEETSLLENIRIFYSFRFAPFLKALWRWVF